MRSIEIKRLTFDVASKNKEYILKKLKKEFQNKLQFKINKNDLMVSGDLHSYKVRERIFKIVVGDIIG